MAPKLQSLEVDLRTPKGRRSGVRMTDARQVELRGPKEDTMEAVVGIFSERAGIEKALAQVRALGIGEDRISVLTPGDSSAALQGVPTTEAEQPGMGPALGAVVGGAVGAATGLPLGTAAASVLIPGIGPVVAVGILGATLLGAGGAAAGAAIAGASLEESLRQGLPKDEVFVYEDALRQGRSLVIVLAADEAEAARLREALVRADAESVDAARERWWIGLRDAEEASYTAEGRDFRRDEAVYRRGFQAALAPETRGRGYNEVVAFLRARYPEDHAIDAFRRGYERGRQYDRRPRGDTVADRPYAA
jgi:hypothetical protein